MARPGSFSFQVGKRELACHGVLLLGYPLNGAKELLGLKVPMPGCRRDGRGFDHSRVKRDLLSFSDWLVPFFPTGSVWTNSRSGETRWFGCSIACRNGCHS